eukprot:02481.XXX_37714_37887_1 [CDS] Oithona nana genome sequencing.
MLICLTTFLLAFQSLFSLLYGKRLYLVCRLGYYSNLECFQRGVVTLLCLSVSKLFSM